MSEPRIVLDARCLRGAHGGVATYTAALVAELPRLLPTVPFTLLRHPDAPAPLSRAPNVTERPLGGDPNDPLSHFVLGRLVERHLGPDDLFHAPYRILPHGVRPRSVMTLHDMMQVRCPELVFPDARLRPVLHRWWTYAVRRSLRRAGRIIAVSRHSADDALAVELGAADRMRVTLLGVDAAFRPMPPAEALALSRDVMPEGTRFFLVIGGGYANKNHVTAALAFARAFRPEDDVHLLVIQRERTLPPELGRALAGAGLAARVHVRGGVDREALIALYNRAEALVFPSLYEGFGLPVLEAMASGCPVVASNLTSLPEVTGDAALSCDPRDLDALASALGRVAREPALRERLRASGLARARSFTWERTARETVGVYREIAPWIPAPTPDR
ncbi:glycosyltransferase family 4 protein [Polyangium aurulentum]|uniref:glycosyltransferase family 4 protein n=1 Tax=Polyangium aurulentum TaxID=2567896 RepID=UPI0010AEA637|nr:glycosyltransferase family 1 protein [Polyangium aurulentum]UQA56715.1 glycosyltransferase family 4 protein [Polyangium aurulentum]